MRPFSVTGHLPVGTRKLIPDQLFALDYGGSYAPLCYQLPVTETGYRSHFIRSDELALFDSPLDFAQQWLDTMAQEKAWQTYLINSQQLSLF